jgi:hypothetical protein
MCRAFKTQLPLAAIAKNTEKMPVFSAARARVLSQKFIERVAICTRSV